jgi:hypothetical protein
VYQQVRKSGKEDLGADPCVCPKKVIRHEDRDPLHPDDFSFQALDANAQGQITPKQYGRLYNQAVGLTQPEVTLTTSGEPAPPPPPPTDDELANVIGIGDDGELIYREMGDGKHR